MPYNVKVLNKQTKTEMGPNGEYNYTSLIVDYQGKESEKKIFPVTVKKYPNLKEELEQVKEGMTIGIETQLNGKYKEISKIVVGQSNNNQTNNKNNGYENKDVSIQVMNAMNNACQTLGEKKVTIKEIETRAWELILLGERLKAKISKGDHLRDNEEPPYDPVVQTQGYSEEDVPF